MEPDDIYKINSRGYIELVETNDDDHDTLMLEGSDGNLDTDTQIKVDKGVLTGLKHSEISEGVFSTTLSLTNNGQTTQLFEFVASNTNVEWSQIQYGATGNFISTSHLINSERTNGSLEQMLNNIGVRIRTQTHSHPNGNPRPSGFGFDPNRGMRSFQGDRIFAQNGEIAAAEAGVSSPRRYVYSPSGYTRYNSKQYRVPGGPIVTHQYLK